MKFLKLGYRLRIFALAASCLTLAGCWFAETDLIGTQGIDPFGVGADIALVNDGGVPQILIRSAQEVSFQSTVGTLKFTRPGNPSGTDLGEAVPLIASLEVSDGTFLFAWGSGNNGVLSSCDGAANPDIVLTSLVQARTIFAEAMANGCPGDQKHYTIRAATASEIARTKSSLAEMARKAAAAGPDPSLPQQREREQKPGQVKVLSAPSEQEMHEALEAFLRSRGALVELTDFRKEGCRHLGGPSFQCAYSNSIGADCRVNPIACLIGQTGIRDSGQGIFV